MSAFSVGSTSGSHKSPGSLRNHQRTPPRTLKGVIPLTSEGLAPFSSLPPAADPADASATAVAPASATASAPASATAVAPASATASAPASATASATASAPASAPASASASGVNILASPDRAASPFASAFRPLASAAASPFASAAAGASSASPAATADPAASTSSSSPSTSSPSMPSTSAAGVVAPSASLPALFASPALSVSAEAPASAPAEALSFSPSFREAAMQGVQGKRSASPNTNDKPDVKDAAQKQQQQQQQQQDTWVPKSVDDTHGTLVPVSVIEREERRRQRRAMQQAQLSIDCTVCEDVMENARLLPCLHTFCEMCVSDMLTDDAAGVCFSCKEPFQLASVVANAAVHAAVAARKQAKGKASTSSAAASTTTTAAAAATVADDAVVCSVSSDHAISQVHTCMSCLTVLCGACAAEHVAHDVYADTAGAFAECARMVGVQADACERVLTGLRTSIFEVVNQRLSIEEDESAFMVTVNSACDGMKNAYDAVVEDASFVRACYNSHDTVTVRFDGYRSDAAGGAAPQQDPAATAAAAAAAAAPADHADADALLQEQQRQRRRAMHLVSPAELSDLQRRLKPLPVAAAISALAFVARTPAEEQRRYMAELPARASALCGSVREGASRVIKLLSLQVDGFQNACELLEQAIQQARAIVAAGTPTAASVVTVLRLLRVLKSRASSSSTQLQGGASIVLQRPHLSFPLNDPFSWPVAKLGEARLAHASEQLAVSPIDVPMLAHGRPVFMGVLGDGTLAIISTTRELGTAALANAAVEAQDAAADADATGTQPAVLLNITPQAQAKIKDVSAKLHDSCKIMDQTLERVQTAIASDIHSVAVDHMSGFATNIVNDVNRTALRFVDDVAAAAVPIDAESLATFQTRRQALLQLVLDLNTAAHAHTEAYKKWTSAHAVVEEVLKRSSDVSGADVSGASEGSAENAAPALAAAATELQDRASRLTATLTSAINACGEFAEVVASARAHVFGAIAAANEAAERRKQQATEDGSGDAVTSSVLVIVQTDGTTTRRLQLDLDPVHCVCSGAAKDTAWCGADNATVVLIDTLTGATLRRLALDKLVQDRAAGMVIAAPTLNAAAPVTQVHGSINGNDLFCVCGDTVVCVSDACKDAAATCLWTYKAVNAPVRLLEWNGQLYILCARKNEGACVVVNRFTGASNFTIHDVGVRAQFDTAFVMTRSRLNYLLLARGYETLREGTRDAAVYDSQSFLMTKMSWYFTDQPASGKAPSEHSLVGVRAGDSKWIVPKPHLAWS